MGLTEVVKDIVRDEIRTGYIYLECNPAFITLQNSCYQLQSRVDFLEMEVERQKQEIEIRSKDLLLALRERVSNFVLEY